MDRSPDVPPNKSRGGRPREPHPDFTTPESLAQQIQRFRKQKGWSQAKLAKQAELSRSLVAAAERGKATEQTVNCLAEALKVTPKKLCGHLSEDVFDFKHVCKLFRDWEHAVCGREGDFQTPLQVDLLFIEMVEGWDFLMRIVQQVRSSHIHFRILMLDGPGAALNLTEPDGPARRATLAWGNTAVVRRADIIAHFRQKPFAELDPPKHVTATVCVYSAVPTFHGVRATKGNSVRVAVGRCGTPADQPLTYTWGEDEHRFYSSEEPGFAEQTREWRERFEKLWTPAGVRYDDSAAGG